MQCLCFCLDNLPHNVIFDGLLNFYLYCHNNNLQYGALLRSVSNIFVIVSTPLTKNTTSQSIILIQIKMYFGVNFINECNNFWCNLSISLYFPHQRVSNNFWWTKYSNLVSIPFLNINQTKNSIYPKKAAVRIGPICRRVIATIHLR